MGSCIRVSAVLCILLVAGAAAPVVSAEGPTLEELESRGGVPAAVAVYVRAFNSGDEAAIRAFVTDYRDSTSLERTPIDVRVGRQLQMRQMVGELSLVGERPGREGDYALLAYSLQTGSYFELSFSASSLEPVRFGMMGIRPTEAPGESAVEFSGELGEVVARAREAWGLPALGVAYVGTDGRPHVAASGVRSIEDDRDVEPGDLFHFGSITKSMTACIAGRLVDRGELSFETTLEEGLTGIWVHSRMRPVTLEQLLTHRAGVEPLLEPDADREARWNTAGVPREQRRTLVAEVVSVAPQFDPGSAMSYSNAGYVVAAVMMEQATGSTWEQLVGEEVFGPLGLTTCGIGWPFGAGREDAALGHWPGPVPQALRGYEVGAALEPAGDVHGSVLDLARYGHALADPPDGWLESETLDHMLRAVGSDPDDGYAMGWERSTLGDSKVAIHNGSAGTYFALVAFEPGTGRSVGLVTNEGSMINDSRLRGFAAAIFDGRVRPGP